MTPTLDDLRAKLERATAPDNPCFKYMDYSGPTDCEILADIFDGYRTLLDQAARVEALEGALRQAIAWFREYATHYASRETKATGDHESARNLHRALILEDAVASATPPAKDDWLLIESAPRDYEVVLVIDANDEVRTANYEPRADTPYWNTDTDDLSDERHEINPTHWQPLPSPPAKEVGNG